MKDLFKYKILLVDDRKENIFALSAVLKSAGYITESALSGSEALKLLLKNEYGLIILDVQMPIMSGFELAELIKGNSKTKDIPLIFLSANATQKEYFKLGHELGALDYLTKPVDETLLKLKVNNFLAIHNANLILKKTNKDLEEKAIYANISYQDLYTSLSQEVFLINKEGIVVDVNRKGKLLCGIYAGDIINKQFFVVTCLNKIFENDYSNFLNYFEQSNQNRTIDFKMKKSEDVFFYGEASILLTLIEGIPYLQISIFDVTENKEKERKLQLHVKVIDNTLKINQSIIDGDSIDDFATKLLHSINDLIEVNSARVYTYDDYDNKLDLISSKTDKNIEEELEKIIGVNFEKFVPALKVGSNFKKIVEEKFPLITTDQNLIVDLIEEQWDNDELKKLSSLTQKSLNVKTFGIIPILSNNVLFGLITFSSEKIINKEELDVILSFSKNISFAINKKQDALKLAESVTRFKLAMQGANEGLWDWNLITDRVYYSPVWKSMLGYNENELNGDITTFENLLHKDDLEFAFKNVKDYLEGSIKKYEAEFRLKHKNGSYRNFLGRGKAIKDSNGKYYRMIGTQVDITQSKKDDLFFKQINDSLSVNTGPSYFNEFTKFCCENLGVKFALVGIYNLEKNEVDTISFRADNVEVHDYKYNLENTPCDIVLKGGDCSYSENVQNYFPKDEDLKKFGITSYLGIPLIDENKLPIGIIALMDDKPMEDILYKEKLIKFLAPRTTNELIGLKINKQLKESETFTKGILSSLSFQIAVINPNGVIISTNEVWNDFSNEDGKKTNELTGVGSNYFDTFNIAIKNGDIYSKKALIGIKSVLNNELKRFDLEYPYHSNGIDKWFLLSVSGFEGDRQNAVIIHKDITDRKLIESQLHKTVNELINKNNDLMQFNYIVSHNLRAPIANILGLVSVLNYQNSESETKKIIEYIGQSIFKMDDLVKDLNEMLAIRSLISSKKEIVNI